MNRWQIVEWPENDGDQACFYLVDLTDDNKIVAEDRDGAEEIVDRLNLSREFRYDDFEMGA